MSDKIVVNGVQVVKGWDVKLLEAQKGTHIQHKGKLYKREPYGEEWGDEQHNACHDCAAAPGQLHVCGCDVERCPKCGGQLIGCECWGDRLTVVQLAPAKPKLTPAAERMKRVAKGPWSWAIKGNFYKEDGTLMSEGMWLGRSGDHGYADQQAAVESARFAAALMVRADAQAKGFRWRSPEFIEISKDGKLVECENV